jgi:hypothetical protein
MTQPHKHADILRAIADGKKIQLRHTPSALTEWQDCPPDRFFWAVNHYKDKEGCEYRIAPETIVVNGVEVPLPLSIGPNQPIPSYRVAVLVGGGFGPDSTQLYYATEADARTVFQALIKPFKGETE